MSIFTDPSKFFTKAKILILGSFHPEHRPKLEELKEFLRKNGFEKTFLADDLVDPPNTFSSEEKKIYILQRVEEEINNSDFNIFILFPNKNDSVIEELTTLLISDNYELKQEKAVVLIPIDYGYTMVEALISKKKMNVFRYIDLIQMQQYCLVFIKRLLVP